MLLLSAASSALAQQPPPAARPALNPADAARVKQAMQEAAAALTAKDHAGALQALQSYLALVPNDPKALYNAACMAALTGESEQSLAYLDQAVSTGFLSFSRLAGDSDLDAIRDLPAYRALLARQEERLRADADRKATRLAAKYGPSFRITRLDDEHVLVVSDLSTQQVTECVGIIKLWCKVVGGRLFPNKPCEYITVVLPARATVASGEYELNSRTLVVNLAAGIGSLSHEFTHALHLADQEGLGQLHPMWVTEGFGTLFETPATDGKSIVKGYINFRLPMLMRVWEANKMPPLSALFKQGFGGGSPLDYGRARYVMYFLQEKGLLDTWYAEYRRSYAADPTGVQAIVKVYGKDLASFEQEWSTFCQAAYHKQVADHAAKTAKPPATNAIPPTTTGEVETGASAN